MKHTDKITDEIYKESFNKFNPTELFSQLVAVLSREKDRGQMDKLIKDLKSLSGKIFVELKKPKD